MTLLYPRILPIFSFLFLSTESFASYSWKFRSTPQQCSDLTIDIDGQGSPPYRLLILPFGPSPLPNNVEARRIIDQQFSGTSTSVTVPLKYPANSQFVAVVSDATGFGSGGTSVAAQVTSSSDASCFNATGNVSPFFVFSIEPPNQVVQCQAMRIWWDPANVDGTPEFLGVIPGGQSFSIPEGPLTTVPNQGVGFNWTPSLRGGTTLFLVGGDSRGNGTAGSVLNTVSNGVNNIGNCLNDNSPSSTPGNPAGGSYPTNLAGDKTPGSSDNNAPASSKSDTNIGAIIGGVIGGLLLIAVILLALIFQNRRKRVKQATKEHVDLLNSDELDDHVPTSNARTSRNELPEYYQPQPFLVPESNFDSDGETHTDDQGRPLSGYSVTDRSNTPDLLGGGAATSTTSTGRKGAMRQLRPVNIIQHDDAGPSGAPNKEEDAETVELPPAYTNIRK